MKKAICVSLILIAALLSGCSQKNEMKDGFYTAEMSDYSFGWKEYLCIMVKDDKVVYAEFNAKESKRLYQSLGQCLYEKYEACFRYLSK